MNASRLQALEAKVLRGETGKYAGFRITLEETGYATFAYAHESYDGPDGNFPCGTYNDMADVIDAIDLWIDENSDEPNLSDWEYQVKHNSYPK